MPARGRHRHQHRPPAASAPIDVANRCAVVEPGVVNLHLSQLTEPLGLFFAPDPSSQKASAIGGNIANNAGGPHCLALGVTTNHVLGVELVTADGGLVRLGGKAADAPGLDLTGLIVGSEGTLGIVTQATLRLLPLPEAVRTALAIFASVEAASEAVSQIIAHGLLPSALEMDPRALTAIEAAFRPVPANGWRGAAGRGRWAARGRRGAGRHHRLGVCRAAGALEIRLATTLDARQRLWAARKGAAGAMGRIARTTTSTTLSCPVPRLPAVLARVGEVATRYDLPIANIFHAGDGNLHPMILFDTRQPGILERVLAAGREILGACIDNRGTIRRWARRRTGEARLHAAGLQRR